MPAKKKPTKKPAKKNPTDPNLLARAVVEAAIGEPLYRTKQRISRKHKGPHSARQAKTLKVQQ